MTETTTPCFEGTSILLRGPMSVGELSLILANYDLRESVVVAYPGDSNEPNGQIRIEAPASGERIRKLASGMMWFDREFREITVGDPPVLKTSATPIESILFNKLTEEEDRVVSRRELHRIISGGAGDMHLVDVHISNLRKKMGPARSYIKTLRSVGFFANSAVEIKI